VNTRAGTSSIEQAELARIIGPAHQAGFKTIFMAPGHYGHAHIAMANGGVIGEPVFGRGAWSGRSYSFAERGNETVLPGVHGRGGRTVIYQTNVHLAGVVAGGERQVVDLVARGVKAARKSGHLHKADFQ
jgi:hypothetical protein